MAATTTTLNAATTAGDKLLTDTLVTVDSAAAPTDARAQVMKIAYGAQGDAVMVSSTSPMPVASASAPFWRVGFAEVGSGLQGLAAAELDLLQTGAGMAVNQTGGNLVITTGTTVNSETVIRSKLKFKGALLARYKAILSQRIVNQIFRFELADLVGEGLSYTINSATSVTVTFPTTNPFTAANVGQSIRLSRITGAAGIPGRYAIASVSGLTVTFTVAAWPATGTGTLTLYGHNWIANEYSGATATNSFFDCQRRGWASGNTTATINTTATGHVGQIHFDVLAAGFADALVASSTGYQWTNRASRIENIPDEDAELYFVLVVQNGSTAPASTTTLTVGFIQVEDQPRQKVRLASADPAGSHPAPVQLMGGTTAVTGTVTANIGTGALAAGANAIGDVGVQYRASATGAATPVAVMSPTNPTATTIKASAGRIIGWQLQNSATALRSVKVYMTAAPTLGSTAAAFEIDIPAGGRAEAEFAGGIAIATAATFTVTAGKGLTNNDSSGLALNDVSGCFIIA